MLFRKNAFRQRQYLHTSPHGVAVHKTDRPVGIFTAVTTSNLT
jgi:hypothetical protein